MASEGSATTTGGDASKSDMRALLSWEAHSGLDVCNPLPHTAVVAVCDAAQGAAVVKGITIRSAVDLGCGKAAFLAQGFCAFPELSVGIGVDKSSYMLSSARSLVASSAPSVHVPDSASSADCDLTIPCSRPLTRDGPAVGGSSTVGSTPECADTGGEGTAARPRFYTFQADLTDWKLPTVAAPRPGADSAADSMAAERDGVDAVFLIGGPVTSLGGLGPTLAKLKSFVGGNGVIVFGDAFWATKPTSDYLEALGCEDDSCMPYKEAIEVAFDDARLEVHGAVFAKPEDWETYENAFATNLGTFSQSNKGASDAELRAAAERAAGWAESTRKRMETWGPAVMGFGVWILTIRK